MRLLFVHQNFPAQFKHLARHCARDRGHAVVAIGEEANLARNQAEIGAIRCVSYAMPRLPPSPVHRYVRGAEIAKRRAELVRDAAAGLARGGFIPHVICVHPGWGEALLLKEVFPDAALLGLFEFFFGPRADADFDPEFPALEADDHRIRIKDGVTLDSFDLCDWGVTPTRWQRDQFPERCRDRHVYLTYPFVLSWSMIEAMSCGCAVVGSATPPVQEVISDGDNGLLVEFFETNQLVDAIHRVLDHPDRMQAMRAAARQTAVERYDLTTVCLPRQVDLVEQLAASKRSR